MIRLDDLTNNSTIGTNGKYLVGSKKKENALKASTQVWEGGLVIVVSYSGTNYVKITDGAHTFTDLASEGGAATVTSNDITDASTVGKAVLVATNAAAARTAIGAPSVADVTAKVAKAGDTMTGQLIIADVANQTKAILAKHPTGSFSDAPTAFDLTSSYLHLGGVEYGTNSYRLLTFGYRRSLDKSHAPAVIGYQETSASTDDKGRLIFATRDVVTDTAPIVRLHIETNGDIAAQAGARFVGNGNGLTGVIPTGTDRQVLGYNSGGAAEAVTIGWKQLSDLPTPPPFSNGVLTGTAFNPDGTALFAFIQLDVANAAVPSSIPLYTDASRLTVANGVANGDAVNLGQLNGRLSAAQRTAINALVAATSTTEDVINALKAI